MKLLKSLKLLEHLNFSKSFVKFEDNPYEKKISILHENAVEFDILGGTFSCRVWANSQQFATTLQKNSNVYMKVWCGKTRVGYSTQNLSNST